MVIQKDATCTMKIESGVRGSNNFKFPFKIHVGVMGKMIQQPTPGRIGSLVYSQKMSFKHSVADPVKMSRGTQDD